MNGTCDDGQLDALLAKLADEDVSAEPTPDLEARTLVSWEVWREENRLQSDESRSRVGLARALGGVAAGLLVTLVLFGPFQESTPTKSIVTRELETPSADRGKPSPAVEVSRTRDVAHIQRSAAGAVPVRPHVAPPASIERENFVPLGLDIERELSGSFQLARVQVPRDVLVGLGMLTDAYRGGEPMQAEVVFGEDGMAKAIRLATVSRSIP